MSYTRSKHEVPQNQTKVETELTGYLRQMCIGRQDDAVWYDKIPIAKLDPHWDFTIKVSSGPEVMVFINDKLERYLTESAARANDKLLA